MFAKNNLFLGMVAGAIFPVLSWWLFEYPYKGVVMINKPAIPYFIALALNLLLLRVFHNNNADKTSRGIMISTFLFMILIFLIKLKI